MLSYRDNTLNQVRTQFADLLLREQFVVDKGGGKVLEIFGASFIADEDAIFGTLNEGYAQKEIDWYLSQSLNVNDLSGGQPPATWVKVADPDGFVNSNYGWAVLSTENYSQMPNVLKELVANESSRRSVMIYTRPSMWLDYNKNGRSDFMCTNAVQYGIRDGYLDTVVQMRSNDIYWGYRNDYHWQKYVRDWLLRAYNEATGSEVAPGQIIWQAGSLHIYEKDFFLVDHFEKTGKTTVSKKEYRELYPESPWI